MPSVRGSFFVFSESEAQKRQGIQPLRLNIQEFPFGSVELRAEDPFAVLGTPQQRVVDLSPADAVMKRRADQVQCFVLGEQVPFGRGRGVSADPVCEDAVPGATPFQAGDLRRALVRAVSGPAQRLHRRKTAEVDGFASFQVTDGALTAADFHLAGGPGADGGGDILFEDHFASSFHGRKDASRGV